MLIRSRKGENSMNKLWILIKVLVLVATLAGLGAAPVARADEVVTGAEGKSALEHRMQAADFLRHNTGAHRWVAQVTVVAQSKAIYGQRTRDAEFLRHNTGTHPWVAQVTVVVQSEAVYKLRTLGADFLRHNYGTNPWKAQAVADAIR
jgi:hypothetical protein